MELSPLEVRVLGCLMEKQLSTPDVYPLSLNALTNACNQASNRAPVLAVGESDVEAAVDSLVDQGLAERWPGRAMKYAHLAKQTWHLAEQEAAILAELLLRGPQTPGELRTNSKRMYAFTDLAEIDAALASLMEAEPPLVIRLPKAPGAREARAAQLLGGPVDGGAPLAMAPAPSGGRLAELESEVASLKEALATLRAEFEAFKEQF
ncbi:MAG TPA: YceH family protein [Holophagaceae bacterium]|nr:YceH family protein [Holophagaceae bacterium]